MAITKYILSEFDYRKASEGVLCVCVKSSVSVPGDVYSNSALFIGAGICSKAHTNFEIIINGKPFIFTASGAAYNDEALANDCKLTLGSIEKALINRGNVVSALVGGDVATRSEEGEEIVYTPAEEIYGDSHNVYIDSLNARDQFASQALQMLLARTDKDPATLSADEMAHLSNVAYQWASNMMAAAANARASLQDNTESAGMAEAEVGVLDTTTDKLLNNIVVSLRKTDYEETSGGTTEFSERIINPTLNKILQDLMKNGNSTVGLKDLITAINSTKTVNVGASGLGRDSSHPIYTVQTSTGTSNTNVSGTVSIGDSGLGRDSSHPIHSQTSGTFNIGNSGLGRNSSNPVHITGQLTGSDTTVNFDTAGLITATNGIATAISNESTSRSVSGTVSIGSSGLGRNSSNPIYTYTANEKTDAQLIALIDQRIQQWLSSATITITSPQGTFDATFDMRFEDFSGLQATLHISTPNS